MTPEDRWNDQEKGAFQDLKREIDPGPEFDRRLRRRLRDSGALAGASPQGRRRVWLQVAAGLALFALGLALGTWFNGSARLQQPAQRYALLLLPGDEPAPSASPDQQIAEYGEWARELRRQGRFVSGERLAAGGPLLPSGQTVTGLAPVQGFFIISAPTPGSALATAQTHPHLRYGGRIAVREILSTN